MISDSELLNHLKDLECYLLLPEIRNNPEKLNELIADEFFEFGSSGSVWTKQRIINELINSPIKKITASDFKLTRLADDIVLLTYKSHVTEKNNFTTQDAQRSSIWKKIGVKWKIIFHQGTIIRK